MPISDEVIELAPVKKTKKTLIIMIAGMGVLFALAIAFLVMYLLKPSVTEDTNHVKDISVSYSELFSELDENEHEVLYASIGNEYTIYSTVTVDDNSSTNVTWDWDKSLLEVAEQKNDDGAYFKFIPRVGMHGRKATITARASSHVETYQRIEFTIVNQGAEDIKITQWGVAGNLQQVKDDTLDNVLEMTVPYYTMAQTDNNKLFRVSFNQLGKYNATAGEYSKLTCVDIGDNKNTSDVSVTLKNPTEDSKYIDITEGGVTASDFTFRAKSASINPIEIIIQANVNNATDCKVITKTIKVNVESDIASKYVDTLFVFNKPVVDDKFIASIQTGGNTAQVSTANINKEIEGDKTLKVVCGNKKIQNQLKNSADFELVLPYSSSYTYNEIFKHVVVNPTNIQYVGGKIVDNWYQYIEVTSSDTKVMKVNTSSGVIKIAPIGLSGSSGGTAKCKLILTDKRPGSAGSHVEVPVRIVAQTKGVALKVTDGTKTYEGDKLSEIDAGAGKTYTVTATYTVVATADEKLETFLENNTLNNAYSLKFDADELDVMIKGSDKPLLPDTIYTATFIKLDKTGGSGAITQYTALLDFTVKVKKDDDGAAVLRFVKDGAYLYDSGEENSLSKLDVAADIAASFTIVESASKAELVSEPEGIKLVTNNGEKAGNFVRESDTKARLYVQRQDLNSKLELVLAENVNKFIKSDKSFISIDNLQSNNSEAFSWNDKDKVLTFKNNQVNIQNKQSTVKFNVLNINNDKIAEIELDLYVIDAITKIVTTESKDPVYYGGDGKASVTLVAVDVQIIRQINTTPTNFTYYDVDLYYNDGDTAFGADVEKATSKTKNKTDNTISFKHNDTELFVFSINNRTLSIKTDIYAYSREMGINFGNVELEFLLGETDEYVGKHTGGKFDSNYSGRMSIEFVRNADGVALFKHADCEEGTEIPLAANKFTLTVNQDVDAEIYACSIVKIDGKSVYVERKSESNGKIASVAKASFSLPQGITATTQEGPQSGRHYYITFRSPKIDEADKKYDNGGTVYYSGNSDNTLVVVVNNQTRTIKTIGFYSDEACDNSVSELLFGGFINDKVNKYSNTVYIKVEYNTLLDSHTAFEPLELSLPSYLEWVGRTVDAKTNNYVYVPSEGVKTIASKVFPCEIRLIGDEEITESATITAMPSNHKADGKNATCTANVKAGLKTLTVKNGQNTVATVTAGNTGTINYAFNLSDRNDLKSLTLDFVYEAINGEGYDVAYDHTGAGLKLVCPTTVNGLAVENNIKAAVSQLTLKTAADAITLSSQKITLTFTDEYNGANANNVFTLDIYITVTLDIYDLAFDDATKAEVTVTGNSADAAQTASVVVKYNGGTANTQPTSDVIEGNKVVYVYTKDGESYVKRDNIGITVKQVGATYTLIVPNDIDWKNNTYYLGLEYKNNIYGTPIAIVINTKTCYIDFAEGNDIVPNAQKEASIVVKNASDRFTLAANVLNDGSNKPDASKTITYGLYSDPECTTAAECATIANNGVISFINPGITGTVYYRALYEEENLNNKPYELKVTITYTLAPSAVALSDIASDLYDSTDKIITLYYNANGYTSIDLTNYISVTNAFNVNYGSTAITKVITPDSELLQVNGLTIKPVGINNNSTTDVKIVLSATYAGVTKESTEEYTVRIVPINGVSFDTSTGTTGTVSLADKTSKATATPVIGSYTALTPDYTFAADTNANGLFDIDGAGNVKTIALANNTTAQKDKAYTFTATLTYSFNCAPFTASGSFSSTDTYTVNVVGDYNPVFNLTAKGNAISPYNNTDATKYSVVDKDTEYGIVVTRDDSKLINITYSALATNVVTVAAFTGKTASVTLEENASGAFSITVTATVGGSTYTCTQSYYFMYANDVATKLYVSKNNGTYTEFNAETDSIDFSATPNKFKYEISGLPSGAEVNIVINGDVTKVADTTGNKEAATRYVEVKTEKPTTLKIGGSVKVGTRTIYLQEKTVELTATAPEFVLSSNKSEILPTETATFTIEKASNFQGTYTVTYAINSDTYATIDGNVLTAKSSVHTDQTVNVTATVNVSNGVYVGTYTLNKIITVKGVVLPTIAWKDSANKELCLTGKDSHFYSANDYAFNNNNESYDYADKVSISVTPESGTLLVGSDVSYNASTGRLALISNSKTQAGGSLRLKVTATITSGAHASTSVSDTITVRVLPTMNTAVDTIALGNAKNTYDLNGDMYKSVFAPNTANGDGFVHSDDEYSIVSLGVDNTTYFGVNGANLIVKNNLTTAATVYVTATVLITSGEYKGVTVTGTKEVAISVPTKLTTNKAFTWNTTDNKYNTLTLSTISDLMGNVSGTMQSVVATVDDAAAGYVSVTTGSDVVLAVDKAFGAYLEGTSGNKTFDVNYVVTLADGKVYYGTATYDVPKQKITVKAEIGGDELTESAFEVKSGEVALIDLSVDKGFVANVKNATVSNTTTTDSNTYLTAVSVGDGVKLTANTVSDNITVNLSLELSVAGLSTTLEYTVKIVAPQTDAAYSADNRTIYLKQNSSEEVTSTWSYNTSDYKYGDSVKIQASSGNLSKYFSQIKVAGKTATISGSSVTVNFDKVSLSPYPGTGRPSLTNGFNIDFIFKTTDKVDFSFTVTLTVYNSQTNNRNSITVPYSYNVHVINELTVSFDKNGDNVTDCAEDKEVNYKTNYGTLPDPKRVGYTFAGWYTARTDGDQVYSTTTVNATQDHTLYARWTVCSYSLQYDVAVADKYKKTVKYNEQYGELPTPTKTGFEFMGWKNDDGKTVVESSLVQPTNYLSGTIELTAQWKEKYFTVTLNESYSGGTTWTMPVQEGSKFKLHNSVTPARGGYRFDGWYMAADGNTKAATEITVMADVTLYAHWTELYTVSFALNYYGATDTIAARTYANGEKYGLLEAPVRAGYRFDGWFTAQASGSEVTKDTDVNLSANQTLYAHWTQLFTVTLDLSGGSIAGKVTYTVASGEKFAEHLNIVPTREGYRFEGWSNPNAIESVTDNVTITAIWKKLYTVTLNLNDNGISSTEYTYTVADGEAFSTHLTFTPTCSGYTFLGWYSDENSGDKYESEITVTGNTTLYVHWQNDYATEL